MSKVMGNEPPLLLRVIASILLDSYRESLLPKKNDSLRETGLILMERDRRQQNRS